MGEKKKDKDDHKLEDKIEQLQRTLKEKDNIISDLKERNTKQEKKIDDQTRARLVKEKDAIILELKDRIRKKDDQTRARLASPDSPVAKSVLDATLLENRDLHLRIEAMLLQVQEEKRLTKEATVLAETYKRELTAYESKNVSLEKELQAAKADIAKLQLHLGELLNSSKPPTSLSTSTSSASSASTTPTKALSLPPSPRDNNQSNNIPSTPVQSSTNNESSSPSIASTNTTSTTPTKENHYLGDSILSSDSSISEGDTFDVITALSPRDNLVGMEPSHMESYDDLSKLAKELDTDSLDAGSSLSDLMSSLDSVSSPAKALDFDSLTHATDANEVSSTLISPTAHMERCAPFHSDSNYDQDFIYILNHAFIIFIFLSSRRTVKPVLKLQPFMTLKPFIFPFPLPLSLCTHMCDVQPIWCS